MHCMQYVLQQCILIYWTVFSCATFTPCTCARGQVIGRVIVVIVVVHKKSPDLGIQAPQRLQSITNLSELVKSWPQDAQNRVARPTSFTNGVFQLAIIATPIDYAHYVLCMYFCSRALALASYVQVKVVDSICPSCTMMQMQGARRVCALRALVLKSQIILQN